MIQFIDTVGFVGLDQLLVGIVDVAVKSAFIIAIAWLACKFLRRSSASLRSLIWLLAIGLLLVVPVTTFMRSGNSPTTIPAIQTVHYSSTDALPADKSATTDALQANTGTGFAKSGNEILHYSRPQYLAPVTAQLPTELVRFIIIMWFLGILVYCILLVRSMATLQQAKRMTTDLRSGKEFDLLAECLAKTRRKMDVHLANAGPGFPIAMPLTWGYFKPVIVLPSDSAEWEDERLKASLLHEIAHIERRDWISQVIVSLVCCTYWFNPLVWLAARQMRLECELASDDYAVSSGISATNYAEHLLTTARSLSKFGGAPNLAIAMGRKSRLEFRLSTILNPNVYRAQSSGKLQIVAIFSALIIAICIAQCRFCFGSMATASSNIGDDSRASGYTIGDGNDAIVAQPQKSSVELANGIKVTLVGVGDSQNRSIRAWSADRGLTLPVSDNVNSVPFKHLSQTEKGRTFEFALTYLLSPPAVESNPDLSPKKEFAERVRQYNQWYINFYNNWKDQGITTIYQYYPNAHLNDEYPTIETLDAVGKAITDRLTYSEAFNADRGKAQVRIGAAAGPFADIVELSDKANQTVKSSSAVFTFTSKYLPGRSPVNGSSNIIVTDNLSANHTKTAFTDFDRRVICFHNGHKLGMYKLNIVTNDAQLNFTDQTSIPNNILSQTTNFAFVARPYYWAEFDDVQLDRASAGSKN